MPRRRANGQLWSSLVASSGIGSESDIMISCLHPAPILPSALGLHPDATTIDDPRAGGAKFSTRDCSPRASVAGRSEVRLCPWVCALGSIGADAARPNRPPPPGPGRWPTAELHRVGES